MRYSYVCDCYEINDAIELAVRCYPVGGAVVGALTHKFFVGGASRFNASRDALYSISLSLRGFFTD
jgi:hypothetical protein